MLKHREKKNNALNVIFQSRLLRTPINCSNATPEKLQQRRQRLRVEFLRAKMQSSSAGFVPWAANATTDATSGANYVSALLSATSEPADAASLLH